MGGERKTLGDRTAWLREQVRVGGEKDCPATLPSKRGHLVQVVSITVGVAIVGFAVLLALNVGSGPSTDTGRLVGKKAPAFDLPTLGEKRVVSDDFIGKVIVVNFWNSWCIPCRQEHPALVAFHDHHRNEHDFVMVGIVRDDTETAVRDFLRSKRVDWTVALDPGSIAALDFGTTGQPETFVIDPDGLVAAEQFGPSTLEDLEAMLSAARRER